MKLTNDKIFAGIQILEGLHETGKLGYACARNLRKLRDAGKEFIDKRDELIMKYGEEQDNGKFIIPHEKISALNAEISEYSEIEHEVDIMQVSPDVFCSGSLDSQAMYKLDWMVEEPEPLAE